MATKEAMSKGALSPASRKKALKTKATLNALRIVLAEKYGLTMTDFYGAKLAQTIRLHNIPIAEIPPELIPTTAKFHAQMAPSEAGVGIPLDAIPDKAQKAPGVGPGRGNYPRRAGFLPEGANPNAPIILRVLDMLEGGKVSEPLAERLVTLLEKLV